MTEVSEVPESSFKGQLVMPFYIICDASASMSADLPDLQASLEELVTSISSDPVVEDTTMISIIAFGTEAKTLVPLSPAGDIGAAPTLSIMGGTSYSSAFKEFSRRFPEDFKRLRSEGSKVYRPCIFFLTDGMPTDPGEWESTFQDLIAWDPKAGTGNKHYPYIVSYGFRDATEQIMKKIAYPNFGRKPGAWFMARTNNVRALLESMIGTIGKTIVSSSYSIGRGEPELMIQAQPSSEFWSGNPDILE